MGVKISKRSSYKSQPKVFKLFLNFLPIAPHKNTLIIFEILSLRFLMIFFSKISNSPLYPMEKPKTSIIWKTSDCRAKRSKTWDSGVVQVIYVQLLEVWPLAKFHPKYGDFENWPVSRKPPEIPQSKNKLNFDPLGQKERICVCNFWNFGDLPRFMPKYGNHISETALHRPKISSISTPPGVEREYMCNFWNFGQLAIFMPKYSNLENRPVSQKLLPVEQK